MHVRTVQTSPLCLSVELQCGYTQDNSVENDSILGNNGCDRVQSEASHGDAGHTAVSPRGVASCALLTPSLLGMAAVVRSLVGMGD